MMVIEVNASPGLKGIEQATKTDVAAEIIAFIEQSAAPGRTETKGQKG